ncbi:MAG TPA: acyltransferase [Actinospica sp.]|nr:acyltransferase [Actinospica sp.]
MARNRYADLLRITAIGGVVYGHWLLVSVTYRDGRLSGLDAVDYVSWGRWVTWLFQVMPVFFLVGGYVNGLSWSAHRERGEAWSWWVRDRAVRLLWPTAVYIAFALVVVGIARLAGASGAQLAEAAWLAALHLWFLPVYLLLNALTPALLAAHERWGFAVPAVMAVGAAVVDVFANGLHVPLIGYANYLFVWGSIHQWGFAWRDGSLTTPRRRLYAMIAVGGVVLVTLVSTRTFRVDMVGSGNTNPPSIALLAFAAAQSGLVLLAEPAVSAWLAKPERWRRVRRLNSLVMNVYLWHFAPVLVIAIGFYATGVLPQPAIGTSEWWVQRVLWFVLLTAVMVPLLALVTWCERPLLRLPAGLGHARSWSPVLLLIGLLAVSVGLARLAMDGFAPGGKAPTITLLGFGIGLSAIVATGRDPAKSQQAGESAAAGGTP